MKISKIYTYPVKGMRATSLDSAVLTKHGFPYDRRYLLLKVQDDGTFKNMAIAHFPELARYFTAIDIPSNTLTITHEPPSGDSASIDIPLVPDLADLDEHVDVTLHNSPGTAFKMPSHYSTWLSSRLGYEVTLVYISPDRMRKVLMSHPPPTTTTTTSPTPKKSWLETLTSPFSQPPTTEEEAAARITFADCAPYLLASSTSYADVLSRVPAEEASGLSIEKFRPNLLISGAAKAWEEDLWGQLTLTPSSPAPENGGGGGTKFLCAHNCGRCKSINIDYTTGEAVTPGPAGKILKELSRDRRVDGGMKWSPIFGRYCFLDGEEGREVRVGDEVAVSRWNEGGTRFDWEGLCTT